MASKYRIIKLKSGETLICTLGEIKKKTIIIERPMNFASHVVTDGAQLMGTEMLLMKNWLHRSCNLSSPSVYSPYTGYHSTKIYPDFVPLNYSVAFPHP